MLPPVYETIHTPTVNALVGDRIGRHGRVAQNTPRPYITWQVVTGLPHDQISGAPPSDFTTVQIDCWADGETGDRLVDQIATAVRDALDAAGISNRLVIDVREPDTKLFRMGLEADFITQR